MDSHSWLKNAGKPMVSKKRVARGCGKTIVLWDAAVEKLTGEKVEIPKIPEILPPLTEEKMQEMVRGL